MSQISEKIGMLTSMFSGKSPNDLPEGSVEFYKNKYIQELENRVQMNEKLAQKDELISQLLSRVRELQGSSVQEVAQEGLKHKIAPVSPPKPLTSIHNLVEDAQDDEILMDAPQKSASPPSVWKNDSVVVAPHKQKEIASNGKVENTEDIAYEELDGETLIPWVDVIKESHPGSLGQMQSLAKQRLEAAFTEFLLERMKPEKVILCRVLNDKNKVVVGLPENLVNGWMKRLNKGSWIKVHYQNGRKNRLVYLERYSEKYKFLDIFSKEKRVWKSTD